MLRPSAALCEAAGTFALVFVGTGAVALDERSGGALGAIGIGLAFGAAVALMILAFGRASGAHLNPAVTLALWRARRLPGRTVAPYVIAQSAGAIEASLALAALVPRGTTLGGTRPAASVTAAFVIETAITFVLVWVVLHASHRPRVRSSTVALLVGATVAVCAASAGPATGASMNPARSLGPAWVHGDLDVLWLYVVAPILGGLLAVPACRRVRSGTCCGADPGGGAGPRGAGPGRGAPAPSA